MSRWVGVSVVSMLMAVVGLASASAQEAAPANGGIVIGLQPRAQRARVTYTSAAQEKLRGPVHTVQEETWDYRRGPEGEMTGSRYAVYDEKRHLVEDTRYDADGKVMMHRKFTRDENGQVVKMETGGADDGQRFVQSYGNQGGPPGEANGENPGQRVYKVPEASTETMRQENPDGSVSVFKSVETTDPGSRTTHQTSTRDGEAERESLTQMNAKGEMQSQAMLFFDGTSIKSETLPDGSVKTHFYNPGTKTNIYKTTDKQHRLTELAEEAPDSYTRTTYQYDENGRLAGTAMFDRQGKAIGKSETKYQFDGFGNWTEQKTVGWGPTMGTKSARVQSLIKRVISYY